MRLDLATIKFCCFPADYDSLAGAVRELSRTDNRVVLVSHRSSDWVFSRQRDLAKSLTVRFANEFDKLPGPGGLGDDR